MNILVKKCCIAVKNGCQTKVSSALCSIVAFAVSVGNIQPTLYCISVNRLVILV